MKHAFTIDMRELKWMRDAHARIAACGRTSKDAEKSILHLSKAMRGACEASGLMRDAMRLYQKHEYARKVALRRHRGRCVRDAYGRQRMAK